MKIICCECKKIIAVTYNGDGTVIDRCTQCSEKSFKNAKRHCALRARKAGSCESGI